MNSRLVPAVLTAILAAFCPPAHSQSFTLTKIIDTNTARPDGHGNFQNPHAPSTDGNYAVWIENGLSVWSANLSNLQLTKLADNSTTAPGGTGAFTTFGQTAGGPYGGYGIAVRNGTVAFMGIDQYGNGVYSTPAGGGTLQRVVNYNVTLPDGGKLGAPGHGVNNIGLNDSGSVVFDGGSAGNAADGAALGASIYTATVNGSNLVLIANEDHLFIDPLQAPGSANPCVENFQGAAIGGNTVVFFGAAVGNFWGIYSLPTGGPAQGTTAGNCGNGPSGPLVAGSNTALPGDPATSRPIPDWSFIQTDGQSVFVNACDWNYPCGSALNGGWEGIFSVALTGGAFTKIVANGDTLPSIGVVTDIATEFSVDNGGIVFVAANYNANPIKRGIFLSTGGAITKIWATGDPLAGETLDQNGYLEISPESYKNGKLVFAFSSVVFLASPFTGVTPITVQTNPSGLLFTVDSGSPQVTPATVNLTGGSHTLAVAANQQGATGTQYVFSSWSDGGAASHTITVGATPATYTATFQTQYQLTTSASPTTGGTVSPGTGSYYNAGAAVNISAVANTGYTFTGWTGNASNIGNPASASTTVVMTGPESVVANFTSMAYTLNPASVTIGTTGGTGSVTVVANGATSAWTAGSNNSFITITSGATGAGNGTVSYSVAANTTGSTRTGTLTIAGQTFTVTQTAGSAGLAFYPLTPCRVADTRNPTNGTFGGPIMPAGSTRVFPILSSGCNIPSTAQAYSLNITVVPPGPLGYLTVWPTGQSQPNVSTLNSSNGAILANAAIVPAGTSPSAPGAISIYVSDATHVIIDIDGYFAPQTSQGLAFYPVTPCRVADTRNATGPLGGPSLTAGQTRNFAVTQSACGIPATAQAYALNMTVVPPGALQYLTTWPAGQSQPYVSTLNALQGQIAANAAIVPAGANQAVSVFVSDPTNVVIDISGYFAPPGGAGALYFYPATPCRVADTRGPNGTLGGPALVGGSTRTFPVGSSACGLPATAQAYSLNMTVAPPGSLFYLTVWPQGQAQPYVSTLNDLQGQIVANAAIVPAGSGAITVFASDPTNLVIDLNGYFAE